MKRKLFTAIAVGCLLTGTLFAHDLFLRLENYFVAVGQPVKISILNGSFQASEGAVNFARLADRSVVAPSGQVSKFAEADYSKDDKTGYLSLTPTEAGNYLAGISTMTREIDLSAKDFNDYLDHDGIPDTLAQRKRDNELDKNVRERYSKHVKTLFQAGNSQSENFKKVLGYPVEIVPINNPYKLKRGDRFEFQCLKDGKPLADQFVMTGYDDGTNLRAGENLRTNKKGIARVILTSPGKWYVKFIQMSRLDDPKLNYESKWATFTFEIR